jgi:hypothetical protein
VVSARREWPEQVTLWLVALFPALCIAATWLYLNWVETGWAFYFLRVPHLSLDRLEGWRPAGTAGIAPAAALCGSLLLFLAWTTRRVDVASDELMTRQRAGWLRAAMGTMMVLGAPALLLADRGRGLARPELEAGAFALATAIPIVGMLRGRAVRGAAWLVLVATGALGWWGLSTGSGEAAALVRAARSGVAPASLQGPAAIAADIAARRAPADRVLLDEVDLFPVAALLDTAWLPSPDARAPGGPWDEASARFVVAVRPDTPQARRSSLPVSERTLARRYALAAEHDGLRLYERRADWKGNGAGR